VVRSEGLEILGRADELALARRLLNALDGEADVLVVGGEAGVRRTRFVEAVAADALDLGFAIATGACLRMDTGEMPYAAIIAALRRLVHDADPSSSQRRLGAARREVARLLPGRRAGRPGPGSGAGHGRADRDGRRKPARAGAPSSAGQSSAGASHAGACTQGPRPQGPA
jgi:hypothetical protein